VAAMEQKADAEKSWISPRILALWPGGVKPVS